MPEKRLARMRCTLPPDYVYQPPRDRGLSLRMVRPFDIVKTGHVERYDAFVDTWIPGETALQARHRRQRAGMPGHVIDALWRLESFEGIDPHRIIEGPPSEP